MLVNTCSRMCSGVTAVMTVLFWTDATNAVPSTKTTELREPLLAARCEAVGQSRERLAVDVDPALGEPVKRVLGEGRRMRRRGLVGEHDRRTTDRWARRRRPAWPPAAAVGEPTAPGGSSAGLGMIVLMTPA